MARKKKRPQQRPKQSGSSAAKDNKALREAATDLQLEAMTAAEAEGVSAEELSDTTNQPTTKDLAEAVDEAKSAKATYEELREHVQVTESKLQDRLAELERLPKETEAKLEKLHIERQALDEGLEKQREEKEELTRQRDELVKLAAEAETGFLARKEEILEPVKAQIADLTAKWHEQEQQLVAEWDTKLRERTQTFRKDLDDAWERLASEQTQLDTRATELADDERAVARRERAVSAAEQTVDEDRAELDRQRNETIERARAERAAQLREAEERVERLLLRIDELEKERAGIAQLRTELGGDPAAVVEELTTLRQLVRTLETDLESRPSASVADELDDALQQLAVARQERENAVRAQREVERQLEYQTLEITNTERLEQTNDALTATANAYRAEVQELTERFQQLTADVEQQTAFPECRRMDNGLGRKGPVETRTVDDLEQFAEDLRHRMSTYSDGPRTSKQLNYRQRDVRLFLAGLAMSRLHLLEGVSGTGKTTLPHAFAAAVNGGVKKVEVQAGWRDKQDLLGYYNSFERVFRETPFLQALYRAHLPPYRDRLIFIVLDEMNLSHPEQYFADFLSALEDPKATPLISLIDRSVPDIPEHMVIDTGVQLPLPPNVWFVGTANQDETTYGFAPKTYDRAHVMELEPHAADGPTTAVIDDNAPVSLTSLHKAFGVARGKYHAKANTATSFVGALLDFFQETFHVGWGERMDQQIRQFVPVVIGAGGSLGEALDHVVATKVLQKVQGRHSVRKEHLEDLGALLKEGWPDPKVGPTATINALDREQRAVEF